MVDVPMNDVSASDVPTDHEATPGGAVLRTTVQRGTSIDLHAVNGQGGPVNLSPGEARALARELLDLADQIEPDEEKLALDQSMKDLQEVVDQPSDRRGGKRGLRFSLRDIVLAVGLLAIALAPISVLMHGGGPLALFIILTPPLLCMPWEHCFNDRGTVSISDCRPW